MKEAEKFISFSLTLLLIFLSPFSFIYANPVGEPNPEITYFSEPKEIARDEKVITYEISGSGINLKHGDVILRIYPKGNSSDIKAYYALEVKDGTSFRVQFFVAINKSTEDIIYEIIITPDYYNTYTNPVDFIVKGSPSPPETTPTIKDLIKSIDGSYTLSLPEDGGEVNITMTVDLSIGNDVGVKAVLGGKEVPVEKLTVETLPENAAKRRVSFSLPGNTSYEEQEYTISFTGDGSYYEAAPILKVIVAKSTKPSIFKVSTDLESNISKDGKALLLINGMNLRAEDINIKVFKEGKETNEVIVGQPTGDDMSVTASLNFPQTNKKEEYLVKLGVGGELTHEVPITVEAKEEGTNQEPPKPPNNPTIPSNNGTVEEKPTKPPVKPQESVENKPDQEEPTKPTLPDNNKPEEQDHDMPTENPETPDNNEPEQDKKPATPPEVPEAPDNNKPEEEDPVKPQVPRPVEVQVPNNSSISEGTDWSERERDYSVKDKVDKKNMAPVSQPVDNTIKNEVLTCPFTDIKGLKEEEAIINLYSKGIIKGVSHSKFDPEGSLNRAMCMAILHRLDDNKISTEGTFDLKDITQGSWYEADCKWAIEKGIMKGYPDGSYKPLKDLTNEEFLCLLARLAKDKFELVNTGKVKAEKISPWSRESVELLYGYGIIDKDFKGKDTIKRREVAEIINKYLELKKIK